MDMWTFWLGVATGVIGNAIWGYRAEICGLVIYGLAGVHSFLTKLHEHWKRGALSVVRCGSSCFDGRSIFFQECAHA